MANTQNSPLTLGGFVIMAPEDEAEFYAECARNDEMYARQDAERAAREIAESAEMQKAALDRIAKSNAAKRKFGNRTFEATVRYKSGWCVTDPMTRKTVHPWGLQSSDKGAIVTISVAENGCTYEVVR